MMNPLNKYAEQQHEEIDQLYRSLLRICEEEYDPEASIGVRRAVDYLLQELEPEDQNLGMSKAAYALSLGKMAVKELGLDAPGLTAALLMNGPKKDENASKRMKEVLGERVCGIVNELRRIGDLDTSGSQEQSENMRNLILSLATDFRVILVKLAERLFLMRLNKRLEEKEQIALACEARSIYSPLAHRLGLYNVMSEMEDIAMSILDREAYIQIEEKLRSGSDKRKRFIEEFIRPLKTDLEEENFKVEIKGRVKAVSSIWRKMKQQKVDFEEVYDRFAIRIIVDTPPKREKADCWRIYSIITDHYQPNPERLRDWISAPKSNGYESLHTTVVVPGGEWVEVQIRTKRMNEIAEKGLAAHWKYKGIKAQAGIDQWIARVREALESTEMDADNLIEDLKLSQFSKEIFVFTPNGDLKKFPEHATVLDFAFDIHTDIGVSCSGARVNNRNVPIRHVLKNGDKVEIIRSKEQKPKIDWLNAVVTSKAKSKIRHALKEDKLKEAEVGKETLKRRFRNWKIEFDDTSIRKLIRHYKYKDAIDLYFDVATEKIDLLQIKDLLKAEEKSQSNERVHIEDEAVDRLVQNASADGNDFLVIDEKLANVDFKLAPCCNPINGDAIFGFVTVGAGITIHRMNCPNAQQMISRYGYRVVKARWKSTAKENYFPVSLRITGTDDLGIVSNISDVISRDLQVNMRSISIDSDDGLFEGSVTIFVKDSKHLEALIRKLKRVKGVNNIQRMN
ncbi:MAG: RelA/SpoT family protein [Bacteroidetes bacterium]|nr:MAG: RelA/SpoT family protein [Bacteroidota bacterium]